jgi:hypothetical protein
MALTLWLHVISWIIHWFEGSKDRTSVFWRKDAGSIQWHSISPWRIKVISSLCLQCTDKVPSKPLTSDLKETLDLFIRRACCRWNAFYRKTKRIKVVERLQIYKFGSAPFLYMMHLKKLQNLQEKVRSFHEVSNLEAFTVFKTAPSLLWPMK